MSNSLLVLAGVGIFSLAVLAVFAVLITGIQRADRGRPGNLFQAPESHSDALTRRLLVGVRRSAQVTEEDE
jgi:hypothetical protein